MMGNNLREMYGIYFKWIFKVQILYTHDQTVVTSTTIYYTRILVLLLSIHILL